MRVGRSAGGSSLTVNDHMSCFFNQYIYKYWKWSCVFKFVFSTTTITATVKQTRVWQQSTTELDNFLGCGQGSSCQCFGCCHTAAEVEGAAATGFSTTAATTGSAQGQRAAKHCHHTDAYKTSTSTCTKAYWSWSCIHTEGEGKQVSWSTFTFSLELDQ